jgi:CIC family chloride channel protein
MDEGGRRSIVAALWPKLPPLDLRILGKTLLHAAVVGTMAGLLGAAFFAALEGAQRLLLEGISGYAPLRALGETFLQSEPSAPFRPWLLAVLPALGGLASGLLTTFLAPEAAGGGGDAVIEAYHRGGDIRPRVLPVKALAAIATLSTGGAGGREGPTMQIGGAIGSLVGRWVPATERERRILVVAGIAAGMAAVFRTPLGAALLATEMLYRDDFESDALVPAILASVVSYGVVISIFGETTLFGHPARFPLVPAHLPLYVGLALVIAPGALLFLDVLHTVQRLSARSGLPTWLRPAAGGLAMGILGTVVVLVTMRAYGPGARLGVFSGGYGVAQVAISGMRGLPAGWLLVFVLGLLFLAKLVAAALTIGSGGAAGDFAPSLVMGALLGGAYGHAAALLFHDARIDPAAFALVGMGTFYGGIAHAPLAALVMVSEMAGSYDLLVPMMLAIAVALVGLRSYTLYPAQRATKTTVPPTAAPLQEAEVAPPPPPDEVAPPRSPGEE